MRQALEGNLWKGYKEGICVFEKRGHEGYGFPGSVDVCTEKSRSIQGHSRPLGQT